AEKQTPDGQIWKNVTIDEKAKNAETLREFRGNYKYNLMDENVRRFNAEVPFYAQWDDHETANNWYPNEILTDERYTERNVALLAARANRAFHEFMPTRQFAHDRERIYRKIGYGPMLDIFFLDLRSYRGDNGPNRQSVRGPDSAFLGPEQIRWLKRELLASRATWKVIASDMPIGVIVYDSREEPFTFENGANGDGPALGRELDIADLLGFMKQNKVMNTVWLTADVHYTAAHYYDPNQAQFSDFNPFWEFVSGPINAGSYGPGQMDNTFGPQVRYQKSPEGRPNLPPTEGLQFFGQVRIDGRSGVMTVMLKDIDDNVLYTADLTPDPSTSPV
ncbi:MAG: alkaline phosphatase D family protein, partial [Minwuiales bacterium]|nr:alkaline phosphatase D family protein [Minwuiales bacterium]